MNRSFANRLFHFLEPQRFDTLSQVLLAVEIRFAYLSRFRHCVKIHWLLVTEEHGDGILYPFALVLFAALRMSRDSSSVALPGLLIHAPAPAGYVDAAPILRQCIRAHPSHFSLQHSLV